MSLPSSSRAVPQNPSFHDANARNDYTSRFRAIGIPAVAAIETVRRAGRSVSPAVRDMPAILRNGFAD